MRLRAANKTKGRLMTIPSDVPRIAIKKFIQSESSNRGRASSFSDHICPNNRLNRGPPSMIVARLKSMAVKAVTINA